ncbi:ACT domain-containing protein ACR4-like isoform X3 [Panicum virgatum]|nr:ACT domain-containing protein ACR4-like isoform X3 [Panicum virgatum]
MNPPRVTIDNTSCANATTIHVDSANKYGILLEVVQVLTDLKLIVKKAYISSDGGWFMDVFNVTNQSGQKIMDEFVLEGIKDYIYKSIATSSCFLPSRRAIGVEPSSDYTLIELTGTDRPGLLSEVSAVLTNLDCNVMNAEVWTHNKRAAAVIQVTDRKSGLAISDVERLGRIKERLRNVFKGRSRDAKTTVAMGITHTERRLHQMMLEDRDYERYDKDRANANPMPMVSVVNWLQKDYSVVTMRCKDRPKLLFDTVCTLTDMQYVVYHGSVDTEGPQAYQEYYIRHIDGSPVNSEAERKRIIQCLEAAIERRVSEVIGNIGTCVIIFLLFDFHKDTDATSALSCSDRDLNGVMHCWLTVGSKIVVGDWSGGVLYCLVHFIVALLSMLVLFFLMEHMLFFSNVRVCCSQLTRPAYICFATVIDFNLSTVILNFASDHMMKY